MLTISDFNGPPVSCADNNDGSISAEVEGLGPFEYLWSNGSSSPAVSNLSAGSYSVTVADVNGCSVAAMALLEEPELMVMTFLVNDPDCFNGGEGSIEAEVFGGTPPYQFSLNGNSFQSSPFFTGLSSGVYELSALDANGCEVTEIIAVNALVPVEVELGEPVFIELGDGAILTALVNLTYEELTSVTWSPLDSAECETCLTQPVAPLVTTTYSIIVEAENGCRDKDEITVFVDRTKQVYVPNAFSPNGDGSNDVFLIYAKPNSVKNIHSFLVFSRWGESVFEYYDFQPNNPAFGWTGLHRGEPLDPAVFVWFAEIEFFDGTVEILKGDIHLIR